MIKLIFGKKENERNDKMLVKREAVFKLLSPLHHGAEKTRTKPVDLPSGVKSNYSPHRRLPMLVELADQKVIADLPAVSGNSIRHKLRELLVDPTLEVLGLTRLDLSRNLLEMLVSGGGMDASDVNRNTNEQDKQNEESQKKNALKPNVPILIRDRETLRATLPPLSLFGVSYGNRMLPGLLNIGWALPAFKETAHITGYDSGISLTNDITSYQLSTRMDKNAVDNSEEETRQSLFYYEIVSPGIEFTHSYHINNASSIERSAMQLAIDLFKKEPFIGGKFNTGQGEISTDNWYEDLDVPADLYLEWLEKNKNVILEYIDIWNKPEKVVKVVKKKEELEWPKDLSSELDRLIQERNSDIRGD